MEQKKMTVGRVRQLVYKLLDESKPKSDLTAKLPQFIDAAQKEISLYCPIQKAMTLAEDVEVPADFRRVVRVVGPAGMPVDWNLYEGSGEKKVLAKEYPAILLYEKIPEDIQDTVQDEQELELPERALMAVVFFVAAQCNSLEYDQRFFQSFYAQYQGKLANLSQDVDVPTMTVLQDDTLPDWM